jgi:hypothetical protein
MGFCMDDHELQAGRISWMEAGEALVDTEEIWMYTVSVVDLERDIKATQSRRTGPTSKILVYVTRTEGT